MSATTEQNRIPLLDVLRGFALLGILLVNIIGFGMPSSAYLNPIMGIGGTLDAIVWASVDIFAEGAMRCLFAILFGAGIVLFTSGDNAKCHRVFFRRNTLLLMFGLINLYVLIWPGDILTTYAIAGAMLYFFRNKTPHMLLVMASVIILIMSLLYGGLNHVLQLGEQAAVQIELRGADSVSAEDLELVEAWQAFAEEYEFDEQALADELATRQSSYSTLFMANIEDANSMLLFVVPFITLWDALATMLIGMALFKLGVLHGERTTHFYLCMTLVGFSLGLLINIAEISNAINSDFHILSTFPFLLWSYHLGRIGMALGYLGLVALLLQSGHLAALSAKLAAVGRMALSNYLLQSVLGLLIFSGVGLALFGELSRTQLYLLVALIWCLQLWLSNWWMTRYRYGPLEHLWRGLTYGNFERNRR